MIIPCPCHSVLRFRFGVSFESILKYVTYQIRERDKNCGDLTLVNWIYFWHGEKLKTLYAFCL